MNVFFKIIVSFLFVALSIHAHASEVDYETSFEKIEILYEKGEYKLGLRSNALLIKTIQSARTPNLLPLARVYFLNAKGAELDGNFILYEEYIFKGDRELQNASKEDVNQYAKAIKYAIEASISYGNYVKATEYVKQSFEIMNKVGMKDSTLYYELKKNAVIINYRLGFYIKAQKELNEILRYSKRSIVKSELRTDPKTGKAKMQKLSSYELLLRKRTYARMLNLQAEMFLDNGNYTSTDSILSVAEKWIATNIGTKDVSYVENIFYKGRLAETLGDVKNANKLYDNAYETLLKTKGGRYQNYSREAIRIFEYLIPTYKLTGKGGDFRTKLEMFEVRVQRYYGKDNYYYSKVIFVEIQQDVLAQNWTSLIKSINKVLSNKTMLPALHLDRADYLELLADAYVELDQYDEAEAAINEATLIKKELLGENAPNYHMQLLDKASYYVNYTDKFKEAEDIYQYSLDQIVSKEIDHQHIKYITYLYQEATLFELTDRFDQAKKVVLEATEIVEERFGKFSIQYGTALQKQANIDIYKGAFKQAEIKLIEALRLYTEKATSKDNLEFASVLETQARLFIIEGLFEDAEKNLKKAFKLSKRTLKSSKLSSSIEELAILYIHIGRYQETEDGLLKSIALREKRFGVDNRSLINPLNQIGFLYYIKGDYARAEKYALRAMDICTNIFGVNSIRYAESLKLYADIHAAIGDYNNAQKTILEVIDIYKKIYGENHIEVALVKNDLALIKYYNKGANLEIERLFLSSLATIKNELNDNTPIYADVLKNISLFYLETGKIDLADEKLEAANKIWISKFGTADRHAADYFYLKGLIYYKREKYVDANLSFIKSKDIYSSSFSTNHPDYTKALSKSGQMYFILKDYPNAIKSYDEAIKSYLAFIQVQFPALSEREKMKSWNTMKTDFEFYYSMAHQLRNEYPALLGNVYDITMATKALMLNASIKVRQRILNSGDHSLIDAYQSWLGKKEFYSTVLSMSTVQIAENGIDKGALEKQIESLEKYLSESSGIFAQSYERKQIYDWNQLKSILNPNEAAIELIRFRNFTTKFTDSVSYAALIIHKETKLYPEIVVMSNGNDMEQKYVKYYRNSMKFHVEDRFSYDVYWKNIQEALPATKTKLFIAPEGVYNQINLETLKGSDGMYQLQKYQFVQIANTKDVLVDYYKQQQKTNAKNKVASNQLANIVIVGNPTYYPTKLPANYDKSIVQLPGAEKEAKGIYALLKAKGISSDLYIESEATEEKIKSLKSPRFFHIATHGYFLPDIKQSGFDSELENEASQNPLYRSGLLLVNGGELINDPSNVDVNRHDGLLTAYEAMNLDFDNTELVLLSACETGLGDVQLGEGVFGLQRAFIVAGSKNLIMSLFKVSDEVTADLLNQFYANWIATGNKRQALYDAKVYILKKYKEPIYWGAFVLVGLD